VSDVRAAGAAVIAASLFAGAGGSSLGYQAAGFDVRYACEMDEWAAETYEINAPGSRVDRRSVEVVTGAEIVAACEGEVDVLDASPPCTSVSMAGPRQIDGGLFAEFVRLVEEVQPRALVMENVDGLTRGRAKPLLYETMRGLERAGYRVAGRVLDASWYGVPQARERLVLLGFFDELGIDPTAAFPRPRATRTVIGDALPDVLRIVIDAPQGRVGDTFPRGRRSWAESEPAPTLMARGMAATSLERVWVQQVPDGRPRGVSLADLLGLSGFPEDFRFPTDELELQWRALGNCVPPPLAEAWARSVASVLTAAAAVI
jgi:DNA (cytosine-5)-methyltransferase 1